MFRPKLPEAVANAFAVMNASDKIPVNARVISVLWEGVRELYRNDKLSQSSLELAIQFRNSSVDEVMARIKTLMPYIKAADYPTGIRANLRVAEAPVTLGEFFTGEQGDVRKLREYILDMDEHIEIFVDAMLKLQERNAFVSTVIADRLYHEMADIISLSEVLLLEGYHVQSSLFSNFFSRIVKGKRPAIA